MIVDDEYLDPQIGRFPSHRLEALLQNHPRIERDDDDGRVELLIVERQGIHDASSIRSKPRGTARAQ